MEIYGKTGVVLKCLGVGGGWEAEGDLRVRGAGLPSSW